MLPATAINLKRFAGAALCVVAPFLARGSEPAPLLTGRCALDLPLDAGQSFDHQRFLVTPDRTYRFQQDDLTPGRPWRLRSVTRDPASAGAPALVRNRRKWRDGALWALADQRIYRWDPAAGKWLMKANPGLEFMDFEVDMTGRILLVCTADPRTRTYRALLEAVEPNGRETAILSPYPDPGCQDWARVVSPVAAATLQVGYESVQIQEYLVLFNPLARRLLVFSPLADRMREVKLGLPLRSYRELAPASPMDDLCWQVLPKDGGEAWVVRQQAGSEAGLTAIPVDLADATAGTALALPATALPVFPGPSGQLTGLEEALRGYAEAAPPPGAPGASGPSASPTQPPSARR